jgi:DNA replication protein DnaC
MEKQQLISKLTYAYALKQQRAKFFAEEQKQKALEDKEYFALELEERSLVLDISKLAFEKKSTIKLEQKLKEVKQKKLKALNRLNIEETSLKPKYDCHICNDSGKIRNDYCPCFKNKLNELIMQDSQINLADLPCLENYNLQVFKDEQKEQVSKILDISKKFVANFPKSKIKTLVFSGATGVGKTYLSKILAKEVIDKGYTAYYTTAFNLNSLMLKYHTTFDDNKATLLDHVIKSDLLVIDDLGMEPILKNVTLEYLLLVINERQQNNKSTIINTNLAPTHIIDRYGERIFSRLMNKQTSLTISMEGVDLRLKKIS